MEQSLTYNVVNSMPLSKAPSNDTSQYSKLSLSNINPSKIIDENKIFDNEQGQKIRDNKISTNLIPQKIRSNVHIPTPIFNNIPNIHTPIPTFNHTYNHTPNIYTPIPTFNHMPTVHNIIPTNLSQQQKDKNRENQKKFLAKRKPYHQLASIENPDEKVVALLMLAYREFSTLHKYTLLQEVDIFIKGIRSRHNV